MKLSNLGFIILTLISCGIESQKVEQKQGSSQDYFSSLGYLEGFVYYKNPVYATGKSSDCFFSVSYLLYPCSPGKPTFKVSYAYNQLSNGSFYYYPNQYIYLGDDSDDVILEHSTGDHSILNREIELAEPIEGKWNFDLSNDPHFKLVQFHLAYWLDRGLKLMQTYTPGFLANSDEGINVYPFGYFYALDGYVTSNAFFAPFEDDSSIGLLSFGIQINAGKLGIPLALDASIAIHELGHAFIYYVNSDFATSDQNEDTDGNCSSFDGCASAINEGSSDFISFLIFDSIEPNLAEILSNSKQGSESSGGVSRNIYTFLEDKLTAQDVFDKDQGEIHAMGTVWAAFWYYLVIKVAQTAGERNDIKKLFFSHFSLIDDNSTFSTSVQAVLDADTSTFDGKYQRKIKKAAEAVGIEL